MFVPCPHCGFLVALIVSKGGPAQFCPHCKQPLGGDSDAAAADAVPVATREPPPAGGDAGVPVSAPTPVPTAPAPMRSGPMPGPPATTASAPPHRRARKHRAPSFVRIAAPAHSAAGRRWPGRLAVAGLAMLLIVQLLLAQRLELAASERWRPLIGSVCTLLGCALPAWREPAAYTMLARSVQPADAPGVLSVEASFRNDAHWPQPWPALWLSLSDVRGQPVAQRTFAAGEYRTGGAGTTAELAPGQSASVQFEVVEPAAPIVAFTFEFR